MPDTRNIAAQAQAIDHKYAEICSEFYETTQQFIAELKDIQLAGQAELRNEMQVWRKNSLVWHKKIEDGVEVWTNPDERNVEIRYDPTANIYTAKYIADNKTQDWAGTDGSLIVKILGEDSYDYIKTADFIANGAHMVAAAKHSSIVQKYFPNNLQIANEFQAWLDERLEEFKHEIHTKYFLDISRIKKFRENKDYEGLTRYFKERHAGVGTALEQLCADIAESLRLLQEKNHSLPFIDAVLDLREAGVKLIEEKGRPNVMKFGQIGTTTNNQLMVSAQFTQGDRTPPSSSRKRKLGDPKYLSNHVNDFTGYVKKINGVDTVLPALTIDGHSSNPPIGEGDEIKRRHLAFLGLKEELALRAANIFKNSPNSAEPITIPLSTITMLTPFFGKAREQKIRSLESEHGQLADTYLAYQILKHTQQPIKLTVNIDGRPREIEANVDLTMMNLPVNVGKKMQMLLSSSLQERINKRGFNEYLNNINKHLDDFYNSTSGTFWKDFKAEFGEALTPTHLPSTDIDKMLAQLASASVTYFNMIEKEPEVVHLKMELKALNDTNKHTLNALYADLQNAQEEYTKDPNAARKQIYKSIRKQIKAIEKDIYQKEDELIQAKTKAFDYAQQEYKQLMDSFNPLVKKLDEKSDVKNPALREHLLMHKRFLECQEMFYTNRYLKKRNAYRFHVKYLLTNQAISRYIVAFCKSAEDRTGWLRTSLLATIAFESIYHRDPNFNDANDKEIYDRFFSASAMELSASLENTKFNSEARGLQVGAPFTNVLANIEIGKLNATFAKGPYSNLIKKLTDVKPNKTFNITDAGKIDSQKLTDLLANNPKLHQRIPIQKGMEPPAFDYDVAKLQHLITHYYEQDFDAHYQDGPNKILVKIQRKDDKLNPINPYEAHIQALRYLRGILLLQNNLPDGPNKIDLLEKIKQIYSAYTTRLGNPPLYSADSTHWLADQFAKALKLHLSVKKAHQQLTMARDLGVLLEPHPGICTISETDKNIVIEKSTPIKISNEFYDNHFNHIDQQPWFVNAKNHAGVNVTETTWLDNFFKQHFSELKNLGSPATPSSRWLPLPANNQRIETVTHSADGKEIYSSFIRMGIVSAYNIKDPNERNKLAKQQVREIILSQLEFSIQRYKALYADIIDPNHFTFNINYQTLLSPHRLEALIPYTDNNARFVLLAKDVIADLQTDTAFNTALKNKYGAVINYAQTNSSINHRGDWATAANYQIDRKVRLAKITEAKDIKEKLDLAKQNNPNINSQLEIEVNRRYNAAEALQKLLDNASEFSKLNPYQRNIMMAALETHVSGNQALILAGCKSARDRTAIYAAAVKTMQENPQAMMDWEVLNKGIVNSLLQGHHFRSMTYHSAIVKVSDVHQEFMQKLPTHTQKLIKDLKIFSKKLGKHLGESAENLNALKTKLSNYEQEINILRTSILNKNQRIHYEELIHKSHRMKKQLMHFSDRLKSENVDANNILDVDTMINQLNKIVNEKAKIAFSSEKLLHVDKPQDLPNRIQEILNQYEVDKKDKGTLGDAAHTPHSDLQNIEIKYAKNEYRIGKKLVTTLAFSENNGRNRSVYYNPKQIKLLLGSNIFSNRNQDSKIKLVYEAIDQIEKFRINYVKGLIKEVYKLNISDEQKQIKIQHILTKQIDKLDIEITGFPPKLAKVMCTYCALKGYKYRNFVRGANGYFSPSVADVKKLGQLIDLHKNAIALPPALDPKSLDPATKKVEAPITLKSNLDLKSK